MSKTGQPAFWENFVKAYAAGPGGRPPRSIGAVQVWMDVYSQRGSVSELPGEVRLWAPRAFVVAEDGRIRLRGPVARLWRINRRAPGILKTIGLIRRVNPTGKSGDAELRLLALASLHNLISRGAAQCRDAHDVAAALIDTFGLDRDPEAWTAKTTLTLPDQAKVTAEAPLDLADVASAAGEDVARCARGYLPVRIKFSASSEKHLPDQAEVLDGLSTVLEPLPASGRLTWRLMTPGVIAEMVWDRSLKDIGAIYEVSEARVRAFCRSHRIDMPTPGFWRMSEAKREAIRRSVLAARLSD